MNSVNEQKVFHCEDWGRIAYRAAYVQQQERVQRVKKQEGPFLVFCEHPPVLTLGRLSRHEYILLSSEDLRRQGIAVIEIDRGGEVTLHCPGQLVVYPILDLRHYKKDLHWYLNKLEQVAIDLLKEFDILTTRISGRTGVWVGTSKIVSIGVGVKNWITYHGLAINVNNDLGLFKMIKPCGLDVEMTSVKQELGREPVMAEVKERLARVFDGHFSTGVAG